MDTDRIRALIGELQALLSDVPSKTVSTDEVYLPITGKVYPKPRPDLGEMFVGYVQRVGAFTGRSTSSVGSLYQGSEHLFTAIGGYRSDGSNWAEAADRFYNSRAYNTDSQRAAQDAGAAGFAKLTFGS